MGWQWRNPSLNLHFVFFVFVVYVMVMLSQRILFDLPKHGSNLNTEEIGNFLSNEYGLIKHIFKYLPNRDLYRARHVCRSWRSAVDIMMEKEPIWASKNIDNFNRRIRPKFILLHVETFLKSVKKKYLCPALRSAGKVKQVVPECKTTKFCECKYIDEETVLCILDGPKLLRRPIAVPNTKGPEPLTTIQCSSMIMIPEIPGVEFSAFSLSYSEVLHIDELDTERVDEIIGKQGGPLKCLLLFTSYICPSSLTPERDRALEKLVMKIEERVNHGFALGGGVLKRQRVIKNGDNSSHAIVGITIKGDNVSAHSQILVDHDPDTDGYMKKLAERLGLTPEDGKSRMAFIIQCVNKDQNMTLPSTRQKVRTCDYELSCFAKYFPSVPIFGFMGYGEFGFDLVKMSPWNHQEKKRKTSQIPQIQYTDSTSIVVVTFKQQQLSPSRCDFYN